jgi:hypothetical protein
MATFMAEVVQQLAGPERPHPRHLKGKDASRSSTTPRSRHTMSDKQRWFVGGQQR